MIDNLTEAIAHAREVAENLKEIASTISVENEYDKRKLAEHLDCIKNNKQLAAWLTELQKHWKPLPKAPESEVENG